MESTKKPANATINNNAASDEQRVVGAGVAAAAAGSNQGWRATHVSLYFDYCEKTITVLYCTDFPIPLFARFRHVLFWKFPCPAWAVASCRSGPQAGGTS